MATIISIVIIAFLLFFSCDSAKEKLRASQPNFLILIADDAGYRDFGCYGNNYISTPNIDQLAEDGIKATNAFLTCPQCSPSRISVLTGKYAHSTGAEDLHMPLPTGEKILPSFLKDNGYYSGYLKKGHLGDNGHNQFDYYSQNLDDFNVFLDSASSAPFFMWVGFTDPHRPYSEGAVDNPQSSSEVFIPPYLNDDLNTRKDLALYYDEIRRMDQQIGKYISMLEKRNLRENTFIVFFSDNGAPFPREKGSLYDSGIKTPLIFSHPISIKNASTDNRLMSVIDLAPTILDIVGIEIPNSMQGNSITELLYNKDLPGRQYVFSERNWHNIDEHMRSVRDNRYKLISNAYTEFPHGTASDIAASPSWQSLYRLKQDGKLTLVQSLLFEYPRAQFEFYDVLNDPFELKNLINDPNYENEIIILKNELETWKEITNDFPPTERRRRDNADRFTGIKFDQTKLPSRIN
jgi:arylsulfatase A-like enzyme